MFVLGEILQGYQKPHRVTLSWYTRGVIEFETPFAARARLTEADRRYLSLVAYGVPRESIDRVLGYSEEVLSFYRESLFDRIGASTDLEAASYYWVDLQPIGKKRPELDLNKSEQYCLECLLSGLTRDEMVTEMKFTKSMINRLILSVGEKAQERGARPGMAGTVAFVLGGVRVGDWPEWVD